MKIIYLLILINLTVGVLRISISDEKKGIILNKNEILHQIAKVKKEIRSYNYMKSSWSFSRIKLAIFDYLFYGPSCEETKGTGGKTIDPIRTQVKPKASEIDTYEGLVSYNEKAFDDYKYKCYDLEVKEQERKLEQRKQQEQQELEEGELEEQRRKELENE